MFRNFKRFSHRTPMRSAPITVRRAVLSEQDGSYSVQDVEASVAPSVEDYNLKALLDAGVSLSMVATDVVDPNMYDLDSLTSMAVTAAAKIPTPTLVDDIKPSDAVASATETKVDPVIDNV